MYVQGLKKGITSLLYAWIDSLKFLYCHDIKLTMYGVYKGVREGYIILIKKFWWIIIITVAIKYYVPTGHFIHFFTCLWSILIILTLRSSAGKKDYRYFMHFKCFAIILFLYGLLRTLFEPFLHTSVIAFFTLAINIYSPIYVISAFFMSDSIDCFKDIVFSLKYGLKMIVYNYPLFLIIQTGIFFIAFAGKQLIFIFGYFYLYSIHIFLLPIYACIMNILYIQLRHNQQKLYEVV